MEKESWNDSEAREELHELITKIAYQGPRTHQTGEEKVGYLFQSTAVKEWAQNALSECKTSFLLESFNKYTLCWTQPGYRMNN